MNRNAIAATAFAVLCFSCNRSEPIRPEPTPVTERQGLGTVQRSKTADTDLDQLRAFQVVIPNGGLPGSAAVVQGPFVITNISSYDAGYLFINLSGTCPAQDELDAEFAAGTFQASNTPLGGTYSGNIVLSTGAVLCVQQVNLGYDFSLMVSGYVPYQ